MKVNSTNQAYGTLSISKKSGSITDLEHGKIYEGTVTSTGANKMSLLLDCGIEVQGKIDGVNLSPGAKARFMAEKSDSGGITLRLMQDSVPKSDSQALNTEQTRELFKQSGFISDENILEIKGLNEKSLEESARLAMSKIQQKMSYAAENLTMSAINELLASGVSIQKLNLNMLNSVLKQVSDSPEAVTAEKMNELIDNYMAEHNLDVSGLEEKAEIISTLSASGVPVNDQNIAFAEKCLKLFQAAQNLTEGGIAQLMSLDGEISLSDIYSANYINAPKNNNADIELLQSELKSLFEAQGIEDNKANREGAKFLFEYNLPITKENLAKLDYIKSLKDGEGKSDVIKSAASAIKEGLKPSEITIAGAVDKNALSQTYEEIMEFLPTVTDNNNSTLNNRLAYINTYNIPVSIHNLRSLSVPEGFNPSANILAKADSNSKYLLTQIQHRLTSEACTRLINKGVNIDTVPINKALSQLKAVETESAHEALETAGAESTPHNAYRLGEIMEAVRAAKPFNNNLYGHLVSGRREFSLKTISSARVSAIGEFEKFMATPDKSHGDSFEKASENLKDLVEALQMPANQENLRRAEILSRSNLDITYENMLKTGIIDMKVNKLIGSLHPQVAASMIRDGFDPVNSHIDLVLDYVDRYNDEYGENPKTTVAESIYQMDKQNSLSKDDRKALIGLYRMLDRIEKDNFTSIGLNLQTGKLPSLQSLIDSTDAKTGGLDNTVSDEGYTTRQDDDSKNAFNSLSAKGKNVGDDYTHLVLKSFADNINPGSLRELLENPELLHLPLDEIISRIESTANENTVDDNYAAEVYEDIKTALSENPQVFTFLESVGLPATFSNIKTYMEMSSPRYFAKTVEKIAVESGGSYQDTAINLDDMDTENENEPSSSMNEMGDKLEKAALNSENSALLREVRLLQNAVKVQNAISKRQNNFKIPVSIAGKAGQLNMYMPHGYIPTGTVNVSVSIELPGSSVSAYCSLDGKSLDISLQLEGGSAETESEVAAKLDQVFSEHGFKPTSRFSSEKENFSARYDILPQLNLEHKQAIFNIGKAMMKFADNIFE